MLQVPDALAQRKGLLKQVRIHALVVFHRRVKERTGDHKLAEFIDALFRGLDAR